MGGGHTWDGASGPVAFSARSLEQLGWIGAENERLILVERDSWDLRVRDLYSGGAIYKIPLRPRRRIITPYGRNICC